MNKIVNIVSKLILILIISIATSTISVSAVKTTPTPTPISVFEQTQNSRLNSIEDNDTIQFENNSYQQGLIDKLIVDVKGLTTQLSQLASRLLNLENQQSGMSQTYVIGSPTDQISYNLIADNVVRNFGNYTFYLPVDSYTYVESTGLIYISDFNYGLVTMTVDLDPLSCGSGCLYSDGNVRPLIVGGCIWYNDCAKSSFQTGSVRYLQAGYHTAYLAGYIWSGYSPTPTATIYANFNVIASQNKGIQQVNQVNQLQTIKKIMVTKDINATIK